MYLLAIRVLFLEKCLFRSFAHFNWIIIIIIIILLLSCILYIFWILTPYQIDGLQIFFPHSIGCLFTLLFLLLCRHFLVQCVPLVYF